MALALTWIWPVLALERLLLLLLLSMRFLLVHTLMWRLRLRKLLRQVLLLLLG